MFQLREADNLQPQILTDPKEEKKQKLKFFAIQIHNIGTDTIVTVLED